MEINSKKVLKKVNKNLSNGIRTIFVEGLADEHIYKRFFPDASFIHGNSCDDIIKKMRELHDTIGKNPLILAIIDKDLKSDKEIEALKKENIFTLGIREIESIFLDKEVLIKLFGVNFFLDFSVNVQQNAQERTQEKIKNYDEAINVLKKIVSSKYSIRLLLKQLGIPNKGNPGNIEFLCSEMDRKNLWHLVENSIPKLNVFEKEQINPKAKKQAEREKMQAELRNYITQKDIQMKGEIKLSNKNKEKELFDD